MEEVKINPWSGYWEQRNEEERKAEVEYKRIMEEDKDKDFMDILPSDFKNFKRSIIKREILQDLDNATNTLNKSTIYDGRVFDKKEVARYMMTGTKYSNFHLAYMFVPRKSSTSLWMDYARQWRGSDEKVLGDLYKKFEEEQKDLIKEYEDVENSLQYLQQTWKQYEDSKGVKDRTKEPDMEKDGFPRTGRGNMCYAFIPVQGDLQKSDLEVWTLFNPRSKKNVVYTDIRYKKEDDIYSAIDSKGKKVFLAPWDDINNAWDALFSSNKEVYSGWWNRTLITK